METNKANGFASASLVLSIIALCTCCCCYISIPVAALAILFAILSKGNELQMSGRAKVGLGLGIGALAASVILMAVLMITSVVSGEFQTMMSEYSDYYYGQDSQESHDIQDFLDEWQNDIPSHSQTPEDGTI